MDLFKPDGSLNLAAFEMDVRRGTHELNDALLAAVKTGSALIESTHFLIALGHIPAGRTQKDLERQVISVEQWESGLESCVLQSGQAELPETLTESCLHASARAMLQTAARTCAEFTIARITEPVLLLAALEHATQPVRDLISVAEIDVDHWCADLLDAITPPEVFAVFKPDGALDTGVFSPGARRVIASMRAEAEALGHEVIDPRHLLLALALREGESTQYALHQQGVAPRKVQEALSLSLRARARRTRSEIPLEKSRLQLVLQNILAAAAEAAGRQHAKKIAEPHLLRGFLTVESLANRILEDEGINIPQMLRIAEEYEIVEEDDEGDTIADIETVRARLLARLVGQDDAVERILPYVQRMRFGFTVPGKPVGVFLFCGQSGSGKTEMAKELARAVYGSEENLIFIEMGQFNAPESMNNFIGAPPGYIGYGEGKLTNGLRDKPHSVVLFDEVEKAHARVLDALLRFLDEGKIDDPAGPVRDGSQCILILTSNVGAEQLSALWKEVENNPNWRAEIRVRLREEFRKHNFRIEFLNRVDELILFRTLSQQDYTEIARRQLKRHLDRLQKEKGIEVIPDPDVAEAIGAFCAVVNEGARPVMRLVNSTVITPAVDFVLRSHCSAPVRLRVSTLMTADEAEPMTRVDLA
jgi:ATP-dependent Clp protease ATP-binding subunit ClpC